MDAEGNQPHLSTNPVETLWMSYSAGYGPEIRNYMVTARSQFGLSICGDAHIARYLGGLRVLIMRGPNVSRSPILHECRSFGRNWGLRKPTILPNAHRECLQKTQKSKGNLANFSLASEEHSPPIWTIVLELVEIVDEDDSSMVNGYTLVFMANSDQESLPRREILYDKTWMYDDGSEFSIVLWFYMDAGPFARCYLHPNSRDYSTKVPIYFARLLPAVRNQATMKDLYPLAIKSIVRHALDPLYEDDWRYRILEYALLRKSWLPALEVFWEIVGHTKYDGNPVLIARSLQKQPHLGRLISLFRDNSKAAWRAYDSVDLASLRDAFKIIISSAHASLRILAIEESNLPAIRHILPHMKNLRQFSVIFYSAREKWRTKESNEWLQYIESQRPSMDGTVTVSQIGDACIHWPFIEVVNLGGLSYSAMADRYESNESELPSIHSIPPSNTLQRLMIQESHLDSHSLRKFASNALTNLHLWYATGIQNADLAELLTSACTSLVEICIDYCETAREGGQPHAVEQVLPKMTQLCRMQLTGEPGLSLMIVSGRQQRDPKSKGTKPFRLHLSARDAPPFPLDSLPEAVEMTGWDTITFTVTQFDLDTDPLWQEAKRVADRRGIKLATGKPYLA